MRARRFQSFVDAYTDGLKADDVRRLFTRDTREAYQFFARNIDDRQTANLRRPRRLVHRALLFFMAFTMRLSPARRMLYAAGVLSAVFGLLKLWSARGVADGAGWLLLGFVLVNLLILLEVADRLSLKGDLEVAREIQLAMLPHGRHLTSTVETVGLSRPANTVGGDFFDVIPLGDGRVAVAVGDVAGKGSPAALLMALLLAMLRTLVQTMGDGAFDLAALLSRLNRLVSRHAPGNRFITLFFGVYDPRTGDLEYVNAGHMPPIVLRGDGPPERLTAGGIALGMLDLATFTAGRTNVGAHDLLAMYSDGISEAESPEGVPFDEHGLIGVLQAEQAGNLSTIVAAIVRAVEAHTKEERFADDLTILLLRRTRAGASA
jgi:serine phosphatase RsbU (regulator of sigma subunit)